MRYHPYRDAIACCSVLLALFLVACGDDDEPSPGAPGGGTGDPATLPLLEVSSLTHVGAFRVPNRDAADASLGYGGHALGYNPANNSLYFGGHDWYQMLCEVAIPATIDLTTTANLLQGLTDPTDGTLNEVDPTEVNTIKLGGTLVYGGRLIVSGYSYYDADYTQIVSHGASPLDLTGTADFSGFSACNATAYPRALAGYMAPIPVEWQEAFGGPALTGQCAIPITSSTSTGPAATVFDPDDVGVVDPVPGTTVLFHPLDHPLAPEATQNPYYNLSTEIRGLAFVPGTRSVLFFGRHGTGPYCYGTGGVDGECYDPAGGYKGPHAYPYVHQVWAYDANDLLEVKGGARECWDVMPYAIWQLEGMDATGAASIRGVAYDPAGNRVFITEAFGEEPVVHVYRIGVPGS